ncbi:MAG: ABC transporter permease, partial [Thermodesulfobacteriota bacterium]|nr:ABC transporter permease [Thermodesulfobacteriota bacterium]
RSGGARLPRNARTFKESDAYALINLMPSALRGAPFVNAEMPVRYRGIKIPCQIVATHPNYTRVRGFEPALGRFFTSKEVDSSAKVCVLGHSIAQRLFKDPETAVGEKVFFYRAMARVVGVMEKKGSDITGTDQDEQVFVPLSTFMRRFSNQDWITGVYIELAQGTDPEAAKETATQILRERHHIQTGEDDDFSVLTAKDTMQLQQQALDLVGTLGLISSSVSFAVGGLGILSVMVLLVRARRLEIGVRRAVGAKRGQIIRQFLFEAGLLSGTGGSLGVGAALILVAVVYAIGDFPFVFSPKLISGTLLGSGLLGLGAGAYPAWQASRFEVLEVLSAPE